MAKDNVEFLEEVGLSEAETQDGYALIQGCVVPLSFLRKLKSQLDSGTFDNAAPFSAREIVGKKFWASLTKNERAILTHRYVGLTKLSIYGVFQSGLDELSFSELGELNLSALVEAA